MFGCVDWPVLPKLLHADAAWLSLHPVEKISVVELLKVRGYLFPCQRVSPEVRTSKRGPVPAV